VPKQPPPPPANYSHVDGSFTPRLSARLCHLARHVLGKVPRCAEGATPRLEKESPRALRRQPPPGLVSPFEASTAYRHPPLSRIQTPEQSSGLRSAGVVRVFHSGFHPFTINEFLPSVVHCRSHTSSQSRILRRCLCDLILCGRERENAYRGEAKCDRRQATWSKFRHFRRFPR